MDRDYLLCYTCRRWGMFQQLANTYYRCPRCGAVVSGQRIDEVRRFQVDRGETPREKDKKAEERAKLFDLGTAVVGSGRKLGTRRRSGRSRG